jgi:hypothetical protein
MHRVLDIDLDFFVLDVVYWPPDEPGFRPEPDELPVWSVDDAIGFLRAHCGLDKRLPGFVTKNHGELFPLWRSAIDDGRLEAPFHVTHLDAHADLGVGEPGLTYLVTELLLQRPEDRRYPRTGENGLNDANHLAFAIACRWIHDLVYVYGEGGGIDDSPLVMESFDVNATRIQLASLHYGDLERWRDDDKPAPIHVEPAIPYRKTHWESFQADRPYDFVCLTRSPPYTPVTADPIFDAIRATFIDELSS